MSAGIPFGEYELIRRLGTGGMAEVFLARRVGPGGFEKQLVIKRILPHLSKESRFTELFLNEARLAALIEHPNLVHVSAFGQVDDQYYLAMEYVSGLTLADLLTRVRVLDAGSACRIAVDVLDALHAIHIARDHHGAPLRMVHRDVNPRNVMIAQNGSAKLLDFGIAVSNSKKTKQVMGTREHMSPEQFRGEAVNARSDIFCVGVLLFEALTAELPFRGCPEGTAPHHPRISAELWELIAPALSIEPQDRPADARTFQRSLEAFLATRGIEGARSRLADVVSSVAASSSSKPAGLIARITRLTRLTGILDDSDSDHNGQGATNSGRLVPLAGLVAVGLGATTLAFVSLKFMIRSDQVEYQSITSEIAPSPGTKPKEMTPRWVDHRSAAAASPLRPAPNPRRTQGPTPADAGQTESAPPRARQPQPLARQRRGTAKKRAGPARTRTKKKHGRLTIDTQPWTEVYLKGRKLGMTPMAGIKLPAGRHELLLKNPALGVVRKIRVRIRSGRVTRIRRSL